MDRLNFFNPFKDKEITHEDVLTRNFLILVKNIHAVQIALFELIRAKMPTIGLESIAAGELSVSEIYTQVSSGNYLSNIVGHRLVSVVISDDEFEKEHSVKKSDRKARYDGIIICDPSWLFIIENKPFVGNIWEGQLDPNKDDSEGNQIIEEVCRLSWREIIIVLTSVMEHNTSSDIEKTLIDDFLQYVNEAYSWLNPYRTLGLCKGNTLLIDKRCADVIRECHPGKNIKSHKGWHLCIDNVGDQIIKEPALFFENGCIKLSMFAGAVMTGANAFYSAIRIDRVRELQDKYKDAFTVLPKFRFLFRGGSLVEFTTTKITPIEYLEWWKGKILRQSGRDEIRALYDQLVSENVIDPNDDMLQEKIFNNNYQKINIAPSVSFEYNWNLSHAVELDNKGEFVIECRRIVDDIYSIYK